MTVCLKRFQEECFFVQCQYQCQPKILLSTRRGLAEHSGTLALTGHLKGTWALTTLRHSSTQGTRALDIQSTWPLRALRHFGTQALKALEHLGTLGTLFNRLVAASGVRKFLGQNYHFNCQNLTNHNGVSESQLHICFCDSSTQSFRSVIVNNSCF